MRQARAAAVVALTSLAASCAARPMRGDTGIAPFSFDLYDVHCPSGLRVIVERAPGSEVAGVTALVGAGGHQDPPGREGLAHLVEHLTYRAAAPEQAATRARLLALGAHWNGSTDFEETVYYEFGPRGSLPALLAVEAGRLAQPLAGVDEATFAVERDVVRNELRERNENGMYGEGLGLLQQ